MSRDVTAAFDTAAKDSKVRKAFFVKLDFASGVIRVWSGVGSVRWDGQTWDGVGELGEVSAIQEQPGAVASGVTLSLSYNDSSILNTILTEDYQSRSVKIWVGLFDEGLQLIADPVEYFGGIMDYAETKRGQESASIVLYCESWMRTLERSTERLRTDQDQKSRFSGDRGFEHLAALQDKPLNWGQGNASQTKGSRKTLMKDRKGIL